MMEAVAETSSQVSKDTHIRNARTCNWILLMVVVMERILFGCISRKASIQFVYSSNESCETKATMLDIVVPNNSSMNFGEMILSQKHQLVISVGYILPVLGGLLADGAMGRYPIIWLGTGFYGITIVIVYTMLLIPSCNIVLHYLSLSVLAAGVGLSISNQLCLAAYQAKVSGWTLTGFVLAHYVAQTLGDAISLCLYIISNFLDVNIFEITFFVLFLWIVGLLVIRSRVVTFKPHKSYALKTVQYLLTCGIFDDVYMENHLVNMFANNYEELEITEWSSDASSISSSSSEQSIIMQATLPKECRAGMRIALLLPSFAIFIIFLIVIRTTLSLYCLELNFYLRQLPRSDHIVNAHVAIMILLERCGILVMIGVVVMLRFHSHKVSSIWWSLGTGLFCTWLSLLIAVFCEPSREVQPGVDLFSATSSLMWRFALQVLLCGWGEALAVIAAHQQALMYAPRGLESFTMGIFITNWGIGAMLGILLNVLLVSVPCEKPLIPEVSQMRRSDGSFGIVYGMLAGVMTLLLPISALCVSFFISTVDNSKIPKRT